VYTNSPIDSTAPGEVIFASNGIETRYAHPATVLVAHSPADVPERLADIERAVASGMHAAGFLAYEAAPAFDPALAVHPAGDFPLLWFALYPAPPVVDNAPSDALPFAVGEWQPEVTREEYGAAIARVRELIAAGDTYQVNYTFPMTAPFSGDALSWFRHLCAAQPTAHAAFVDTGRFQIVSASPELFFRLDGDTLVTRPMKGTRPRGRWLEEDRRLARELAESLKERAENVMIVDLLRNDMGRISGVNSVRVPRLFDVERYATVWQMTSTIASTSTASVSGILAALFPSGSVTGAPKVRTMQIIRELEPKPRGIYCGAIGWWAPERRAEFNVAIRTATIDTALGSARYHVGGGITWDSTAEAEYEECRAKAAVLTRERARFDLLESMLFDAEYFLLEDHLARLRDSAGYFGYALDEATLRAELARAATAFLSGPVKVRLLVSQDGSVRMEHAPVAPLAPMRLALAVQPVDQEDAFLYHKTTRRGVYEAARAARPGYTDVILWNKRGELTETTIANIALHIDGQWLTPPVESGLLPGVMRAQLLRQGTLREAVLHKADLAQADAIALFNSLRKWMDAESVDI